MSEQNTTENGLNKSPTKNTKTSGTYEPVKYHWFYKKKDKSLWIPFSQFDSDALEKQYRDIDQNADVIVATDGGRYDVDINNRKRTPVYWKEEVTKVRRCSWFYRRRTDGKFLPYKENIADMLEEEYKKCYESNQWHGRVELPNKDTVVIHSSDVLVLFPPTAEFDDWGNSQNQARPRVVTRGVSEFDIEIGEPPIIDHLLFMVHGIGSVCDLKFRTVEEVVDEFRSSSLQLIRSHYKTSSEKRETNRVEVLPISWHSLLHSEDTGIDNKLNSITLESMPTLRKFTNNTILDVLFYTSSLYCQTIISAVGNSLNTLYELFKKRNPNFKGNISVAGHSLGSLILFDLLSHQNEPVESKEQVKIPNRRISSMMREVVVGQEGIIYPQLVFEPSSFFALGSPIGMFITVRGLDSLGKDFSLPTCKSFFNIFHPFDPVAYRIESLVNPELKGVKPVLMPHHKGRKRMHLELKETVTRVGADLKQKVVESLKSAFSSFYQIYGQHALEAATSSVNSIQESEGERTEITEEELSNKSFGLLNGGRRIDYVLQESPFELVNEYIFALSSHVCYWESEDTILFILKEIYSNLGAMPDSQIPQAGMTIERVVKTNGDDL